MAIVLWISVLIVSIFALVKASDLFVDGAEVTGKALGLPSFVVGVVIVGVGTSLPELISSLVAVNSGASEIVVGNVLGSNITNIFLVLGVAALISKNFKFNSDMMHGDLPILLTSSMLLYFFLSDGNFTTGEAIFSLIALVAYIFHSMGAGKEGAVEKEKITTSAIVKLIVAPILIYLGAKYTVKAVIEIAEIVNIGKEMIALTAVALGTSLPEVMVSIAASKKDNGDMVVGNIVGSNIFNTFAVMGIPALVGKLVIPDGVLHFSLPLSVGATLLFLFSVMDKKVPKWEGGFLIIFYVYFIGHTYNIL
jgi:cation:H+ antiporter